MNSKIKQNANFQEEKFVKISRIALKVNENGVKAV